MGTQGKARHPQQFHTPYCSTNSFRDSFSLVQYFNRMPSHPLSPVRPANFFPRLTFHPSLNPTFLSCVKLLLSFFFFFQVTSRPSLQGLLARMCVCLLWNKCTIYLHFFCLQVLLAFKHCTFLFY